MQFLMPIEIPEPVADNQAATRKTVKDKPDVPPGGAPNQVVAKASGNDFDISWRSTAVPTGGTPGQILSKKTTTDFDTLWIAPPGATITTPLIIPDPVGASYPYILWAAGDGDGVSASANDHMMMLYGNAIRLSSQQQAAKAIAAFKRTATDKAELGINDTWFLESAADGYLRFFYGADRVAAELYFSSAGDIGCGAITSNGWLTGTNVTVNSKNVYGNNGLYLQSNGPSAVNMQVGAVNGSPAGVCYIAGVPPGGGWGGWPLCVAKHSGAGEAGIGFVNHVSGTTGGFQIFNDGSIYIGNLNGANSAYVKSYAAAFNVISTQAFKADIVRMDDATIGVKKSEPGAKEVAPTALDAISQVAPVNYRCLQHEMALEAMAPPLEGATREEVPIVPEYRFGLIAEEVQAVAPDAIKMTPHGPALDLSGMVAILWQAVRELTARVDELTGGINAAG